ncbi:MAG: hypothetical protein EKK54_06295 [Neisseriaceae bacterium]|nr:MAG: hypothetical protein EKK54_06295 [Neisseriaceae bacterium]
MLECFNASPSPDLESIFYANLFLINNKVWMISGQGKSEAAKLAGKKIPESDLARDCVALTRVGNCLYGAYDPGFIHNDLRKRETLQKKYKIDFIAHCLTKHDTMIFKHLKEYKLIYETTYYQLGALISSYPYPGVFAQEFVDKDEFTELMRPGRMLNKFWELTNNVEGTKFLLVSWMPTVEEKSELYLSI